tara:strand:+ start:1438 stop:2049 length:612 start_codon:yes stop_codon:yes gene_type:complete
MKYLEIAAARKRGPKWVAVRDVNDKEAGVQKYDMTNLPMKGVPDNCFDGIYSEHFIEHLFKYQGVNFFKEAFRILKPGGIIRTVWPPYEFVEKLVSDESLTQAENEFVEHYFQFYVQRHNFAPSGNEHRSKREQCALGLSYQNGEHLYVWPKKELMEVCIDIGFTRVEEKLYNVSSLHEFNYIETPSQIRAAHSAVVEATKPA